MTLRIRSRNQNTRPAWACPRDREGCPFVGVDARALDAHMDVIHGLVWRD